MSLKKPKTGQVYWFKYEGKTQSGEVVGHGLAKETVRDSEGNLIYGELTHKVYFIRGIGMNHGFRAEELKESPEELL